MLVVGRLQLLVSLVILCPELSFVNQISPFRTLLPYILKKRYPFKAGYNCNLSAKKHLPNMPFRIWYNLSPPWCMTHNYICHCFNWILYVSNDSSAPEVMKDEFLTTLLQNLLQNKTKKKKMFISQ